MANKTATKETKAAKGKSNAVAESKPRTKEPRRRLSKGDKYFCELCGLQVVVDDFGEILETTELYCCGKPMKEKKVSSKAAKK